MREWGGGGGGEREDTPISTLEEVRGEGGKDTPFPTLEGVGEREDMPFPTLEEVRV